jgi:hypothetical protein
MSKNYRYPYEASSGFEKRHRVLPTMGHDALPTLEMFGSCSIRRVESSDDVPEWFP